MKGGKGKTGLPLAIDGTWESLGQCLIRPRLGGLVLLFPEQKAYRAFNREQYRALCAFCPQETEEEKGC